MPDSTVTLVGNLTRDPELRYTQNGVAQLTLGLAVNHRRMNRQTQNWDEQTSYFDVVLWRDAAENAASSLSKGMRVVATGRLEQRSWDTAEGEKRYKIELVDAEVGPSLRWATAQVTRTPRDGNAGGGGGGGYQAPTPAPAPVSENPGYGYDEEPF